MNASHIKIKTKFHFFLLMLLVLFGIVVLFAPQFATFDPYAGELRNAFQSPNDIHYFGTDKLGRDIFSRILYGIRISLAISLATIFLIVFVGGMLGMISAYVGGIVDNIIMGLSNILISCPSMVLAIALAGIMGASVRNAMIAIFVVTISKYIRLTRSLVLRIKEAEYIKSAKMCGTQDHIILIRHILPNIIPTLLITASTDMGTIILELSALSFLGFGVPAPLPELGYMINDGRSYLLSAPWIVFYPAITLFSMISILNLSSDMLRDYLSE